MIIDNNKTRKNIHKTYAFISIHQKTNYLELDLKLAVKKLSVNYGRKICN